MAETSIDPSVSTEFKETNDIIHLIELTAEARRKAMADGVIDWQDTAYGAPLVSQLFVAANGSEKILAEFRQGNGEALEGVIARLLRAVLDLVAPAK